MDRRTIIYCSKGLLWISARKKPDDLLKIKVHRAMGLRSSDNNDNVLDARVTVHMLSGQHSTHLFTVRSTSVQFRYRRGTCIFKFNGVFYVNATDLGSSDERLCFTAYVTSCGDFESPIGCFSISLASLLRRKASFECEEVLNGWYAVLPLDQGRDACVWARLGSPKSLLHRMRTARGDIYERCVRTMDELFLPISDGSVCNGHIFDGQLETDVDAAFCCLMDGTCSGVERSITVPVADYDNSCSRIQNDHHDVTTQGYLTLSEQKWQDCVEPETPHRRCVEKSFYSLPCRKLHGTEVLTASQFEDPESDRKPRPIAPILLGMNDAGFQKKEYVSCCNTNDVIELIKKHARKIKLITSGHHRGHGKSPNRDRDESIKSRPENFGDPDTSLSNALSKADSSLGAPAETWRVDSIPSGVDSLLSPDVTYSQNAFTPVNQNGGRYRSGREHISATSTPVCSLRKMMLAASQRRLVFLCKNTNQPVQGVRFAEKTNLAAQLSKVFPLLPQSNYLLPHSSTPHIMERGGGGGNYSLCQMPSSYRNRFQNVKTFLRKCNSCDLPKRNMAGHNSLNLQGMGYFRANGHENTQINNSLPYRDKINTRNSFSHMPWSSPEVSRFHDTGHFSSTSLLNNSSISQSFLHHTRDIYGHSMTSEDGVSLENSVSSNSNFSSKSSGTSGSHCSEGRFGAATNLAAKDSCRVYVASVAHGSPADEMGLMPGDSILFINGCDVRRWSRDLVTHFLTKLGGGLKIEVEGSVQIQWIP